jgi:hypothetical protein
MKLKREAQRDSMRIMGRGNDHNALLKTSRFKAENPIMNPKAHISNPK